MHRYLVLADGVVRRFNERPCRIEHQPLPKIEPRAAERSLHTPAPPRSGEPLLFSQMCRVSCNQVPSPIPNPRRKTDVHSPNSKPKFQTRIHVGRPTCIWPNSKPNPNPNPCRKTDVNSPRANPNPVAVPNPRRKTDVNSPSASPTPKPKPKPKPETEPNRTEPNLRRKTDVNQRTARALGGACFRNCARRHDFLTAKAAD
jgi:hypothetical protein